MSHLIITRILRIRSVEVGNDENWHSWLGKGWTDCNENYDIEEEAYFDR